MNVKSAQNKITRSQTKTHEYRNALHCPVGKRSFYDESLVDFLLECLDCDE